MKIAILDDWADCALNSADWGQLDAKIQVFQHPIPPAKLAETLRPFDVICVMRERTPLPAELIAALPALRLIVTTGMRNLSIDLAAAQARGVTVCGTQSRKTTTAELTLALMLSQSRAIPANASAVAAGGFQAVIGRDLADLRIGLVGLGHVGGQVARLARAFDAKVSAWSPNLTADRARDHEVEYVPSLLDLASQSDILSLHMVLSQRSEGLIDDSVFASLPANALFVNTSRAGLVHREALFEWLARHPAAQAAVNVFEAEPLTAADPWREAADRFGPRLLLTPHLGYVSETTWAMFYGQTVEAIAAFGKGDPVRLLSS